MPYISSADSQAWCKFQSPGDCQILHTVMYTAADLGVYMRLKIVVAGAGVAGAVIATAMQGYNDVDLICLEKTGPADHVHSGNALNIGPNALRALDAVAPDLAKKLRDVSLPWTRWLARLADGSEIYCTPLDTVASGPGIRILWSDLYRTVRAGAFERIRFHTSCIVVEDQPDGRLKLLIRCHDKDATEVLPDVDLLIAGDGRYSTLRAQRCGAPQPRHLGVANFRSLVDDKGAIDLDDMEQWYNGPCRLIAFRVLDGHIYVSGNLPVAPGDDVPDRYKDSAFLRTVYLDGYPQPDPRLEALSFAFAAEANSMHWARAQEIESLFHDDARRVIFIGDAAHAMCATLGQGATQAIEDAVAFVALAHEAARQNRLDAATLCTAFANLRSERVDFVKTLSWDASDSLLLGADAVVTNRRKAQPAFKQHLRKLYDDVPVELVHVREALAQTGI
jgi:salicylate hydroxylase